MSDAMAVDAAGQVGPQEQHERQKEDQMDLMAEFLDALGRDDDKRADELRPKIKFTAGSLMATKRLFGADYIRRRGYNTENADAKYGPGWLDREETD